MISALYNALQVRAMFCAACGSRDRIYVCGCGCGQAVCPAAYGAAMITISVGRPAVKVPFFEWRVSETVFVVWFAIAVFGYRWNFTLWRPAPWELPR